MERVISQQELYGAAKRFVKQFWESCREIMLNLDSEHQGIFVKFWLSFREFFVIFGKLSLTFILNFYKNSKQKSYLFLTF